MTIFFYKRYNSLILIIFIFSWTYFKAKSAKSHLLELHFTVYLPGEYGGNWAKKDLIVEMLLNQL